MGVRLSNLEPRATNPSVTTASRKESLYSARTDCPAIRGRILQEIAT
jgi:hypothetical protein